MGKSKTVDTPAAAVTARVTDKYDDKKTEDHKTIDNNYNSGMKTFTEERDAAVADMVRGHRDLRMQNNSANYKNEQAIAEYTINNGLKNSGYRRYLEDNEKSRYSRMTEAIDKSESDTNAQIEAAFEAGVNELGEWKETAKSQVTEHYDSLKEQELDYLLDPDRLTVDEVQVASASGKNDAELKRLYENGNLNIGSLFRVLGVDTAGYEDYLINGMNYEDLKEFAKQIKSQSTLTSIGYDLNNISQGIQEVFNIYNGRYFDDDGNLKEGYRGDGEAFFSQLNEKLLPSEEQLKKIKQQLEEYTKEYGSNESVKDLIEYVDGVLDSLSKIKEFVSNDIAYMKQFKSEEEYEKAIFAAKFINASDEEIEKEIHRLWGAMRRQNDTQMAKTRNKIDALESLISMRQTNGLANYDLEAAKGELNELKRLKKLYADMDAEAFAYGMPTAIERWYNANSTQNALKGKVSTNPFDTSSGVKKALDSVGKDDKSDAFDPQALWSKAGWNYIIPFEYSPDSIDDVIAEKQVYYNVAERFQIKQKLTDEALKAEDFAELSVPDIKYADDSTYKFINNIGDFREKQIAYWMNHSTYTTDGGLSFPTTKPKYIEENIKYINETEIGIYNYYYKKYGKEKAEEYLEYLTETLNSRSAEVLVLENDTTVERLLFSATSGLDQFYSGMENLLNFKDDYIVPSDVQIATGKIRQNLENVGWKLPDWLGGASVGQVAFDIGSTTFNMLPSIMVSTVVGFVNPIAGQVTGAVLLGSSAAGNAYTEMLNLGYSKGEARLYSLLVGGSEAGLQYILGGISKLGGTGSKLIKIADKIDNAWARFAIKFGGSVASEGFEEYLQETITPVLKNWALGTNEDIELLSPNALYAMLLGALSTSSIEGSSSYVSTQRDMYVKELISMGKATSKQSDCYRLADKLSEISPEKVTDQQISELVEDIVAQTENIHMLTFQSVKENLVANGEMGNIDLIAHVATDYLLGATLTNGDIELLKNSSLELQIEKPTLSIANDGIVSGIETKSVEKNAQTKSDENAKIRGFIDGVSGKTVGEVIDGRNNVTVGDGRQLNGVSGEAGSKDSAFSLPEVSGESAVSGVDDAFYNNLTAGLRGEKDVGFDGEAEAPIGELSENVDENIDKNSENLEKDLENGQNGEYNKNKGSVDGALEGLELLNSYNMGLEGERHPVTNIYFKRMETVVNGVRYAVVMPCFDSKYKAALIPNQFLLSDKRQFLIADKQLKLAVESNPEVAKQFTEAELKQIKKGRRPLGYTWHHAAEPGSLELVDSKLHNKTGHTGGRYFWGGGSKYR